MRSKIISTRDVCSGSPRIEGTRLTCGNIVQMLKIDNLKISEILEVYTYLNEQDIDDCINYCSDQRCKKEKVISYCQGCTNNKEGFLPPDAFIYSSIELMNFIKSPNGQAFLGDFNEYFDEEPIDFWILAKDFIDENTQY